MSVHKVEIPTVETVVHVDFEHALEVIVAFAESEISGSYFSQWHVSKLDKAARQIRYKIIRDCE